MDKKQPGGRIVASQTEKMSARFTAADSGILGVWWSELYSVARIDAQQSEQRPHGRVVLPNGGWLRLHFGDLRDWRPFISVSGIEPGVPLICTMKYRFDGTEVEDEVPLNYDENSGRYVGVGPVSDGSLGDGGRMAGILLSSHPSGGDWAFEEVAFGYVQLGDS
jgi:hypothetical protein